MDQRLLFVPAAVAILLAAVGCTTVPEPRDKSAEAASSRGLPDCPGDPRCPKKR
jgi:hypothetical protein